MATGLIRVDFSQHLEKKPGAGFSLLLFTFVRLITFNALVLCYHSFVFSGLFRYNQS